MRGLWPSDRTLSCRALTRSQGRARPQRFSGCPSHRPRETLRPAASEKLAQDLEQSSRVRWAAPGSGAPAHPSHLGLVHADQTLVHLGPGGHSADVPQLVGVLCKGACLHLEKKIHSWRGRPPRSSSPDPSSKVAHICVHTCARTQTCTRTKAHTCTRIRAHRHAHMRMYVQRLGCTTWEGGDTHTHAHACTQRRP